MLLLTRNKSISTNLLPDITGTRGLCVEFFKHCLNCAVPRTTFRTFVHRNMPLRLLLGQEDSKTACRKRHFCNNKNSKKVTLKNTVRREASFSPSSKKKAFTVSHVEQDKYSNFYELFPFIPQLSTQQLSKSKQWSKISLIKQGGFCSYLYILIATEDHSSTSFLFPLYCLP